MSKKITIYEYATGHTRDKNGNPVMTMTRCSKEKYEEQYRINWQTAYKYEVPVNGLRYPIHKLPTILKHPIWGEFLDRHKAYEKKQEEIYVCTHNYTAIYKVGTYYYCLGRSRGYRNLTSLKRLL